MQKQRACELAAAFLIGLSLGLPYQALPVAARWWAGAVLLLSTSTQVAFVLATILRCRRLLREADARVNAAWATTEANIERINEEADKLALSVVHSTKRYRETFGIEATALPEVRDFMRTLDPKHRIN